MAIHKRRGGAFRNVAWSIVIGAVATGTAAAWTSGLPAIWGDTASAQEPSRKTTDPPVRPKGNMGQDLFLAIDHRDLNGVQALLKQGADPNSRNGLEFTPLFIAAASHQTDVMKALVQAGANPMAESSYGDALMFASATGNLSGVQFLLSLNASVKTVRNDGMTALMMAANAGMPQVISELLAKKAEVNAKDFNDSTALFYSARAGHVKAVSLLLEAGAEVNIADYEGITPLMAAAMNGRPGVVKSLIEKGAKVDAKDPKGRTALILAAEYGDFPEVVDILLKAGADPKILDSKGRSASAIAHARGFAASAKQLGSSAGRVAPPRSSKDAVQASLGAIQTSMKKFTEMTACISCHHEGLGRITTGSARSKGLAVDPEVEKAMSMRVEGALGALKPLHEQAVQHPEAMKNLPLIEMNEVTSGYSWLLAGRAAQAGAPNAESAAMALVLARQQQPGGFWTFSLPRVPMQSSFFTFTALSVRALTTYGPKENKAEIDDRVSKAKDWFLKAEAKSSEDRASRLLGLSWAGASKDEKAASVMAILADQRADGGWSQMPSMPSDAYATGQALYALRAGGGVSSTDAAYKKGVAYLLRTQDADGSWFVNKRALPANNYFDSAFPHGISQYASFNGTCWATLALLETLGKN